LAISKRIVFFLAVVLSIGIGKLVGGSNIRYWYSYQAAYGSVLR
jgi:hypothetical protein